MATFSETKRHGEPAGAGEESAFFREHGWTRSPRLVQWMVTRSCPLHCPHCLSAAGAGLGTGMSLDRAADLVGQVAAMGVQELLLTGGEPLARPDLPAIMDLLAAHRVRWSLNTAAMPTRRQQQAIESWPPVFVAVSLDGPREIHDAFRGDGAFDQAMQALAYFSELVPGRVAAGTTVTTANVHRLPETFGLVLESGASEWGLHLLVPEGRARQRPDLFLSRRQLKQLLGFAAAKRDYFPVNMADEIGYCGYWEPLVRSQRFFCGAGKLQCVVLPEGDVVPCTTCDLSASAGNLRHQSLSEIWETGFGELRQWTPSARCARCAYAAACQGGCWLQRRHGTECYRDVWHMPQALTATGAAVCLGLVTASCTPTSAGHKPPPPPAVAQPSPPPQSHPEPQPLRTMPLLTKPQGVQTEDARQMEFLQGTIIQWYASQTRGHRVAKWETVEANLVRALPDDAGAKFFLDYIHGKTPSAFPALALEIERALQTEQRSLCLVGLAWRAVTERCLDGPPPTERSAEERVALRQVLAQLDATASAWRREIYEQKLDPFLRQPGAYRWFFLCKAGPPADVVVAQSLAEKRGWTEPLTARFFTEPLEKPSPEKEADRVITEEFLAAHPYAQTMHLALAGESNLMVVRHGQRQPLGDFVSVFDLLLVPEPALLAIDTGLEQGCFAVKLPGGTELSYGDLLRLAYSQHQPALDKLVDQHLRGGRLGRVPLLLPACRERILRAPATVAPAHQPGLHQATWMLFDLYLF